jgi:hypothetical protein
MAFIDALEEEAQAQLDEVRKERVYQGSNPDYMKRAKLALGIIGSYVRLRATVANEHTNKLVEMRMLGETPDPALVARSPRTVKAIKA